MNPHSSDAEIERILGRISDAFYALDTNWKFTYLNERAEELLDTSAEKLVGKNVWEEFPEAAETIVYEKYHEALEAQERMEFDLYYEPLEKWFHIIVYPSEEGLSVYFRDITFTVLKERAIETADIGVVITDPHRDDNPIIYANEGFERLTDYSKEEVEGRNCRFLQGKETDPAAVTEMREAIRNKEPITVTLLNYRKEGVPFWNRVSIAPVRDSDNNVTHFIGFQQDVTTLIEREQRVQLLQRMLRHNLRTEMNILLGNLESISEGLCTTDEGINRAREAGERLLHISERVREIDAVLRNVPFQTSPQLPSELLRPAIEKAREELPKADISMTLDVEKQILATNGLQKAVEELITNALVHSNEPSPSLEITSEKTFIESVTTNRNRPALALHFADTGPRLSELDRQALLTATEEPLIHGTGLGLWMVHWLVTLSGGEIEYHEREPQGNLITLRFLLANSAD